MISIKSKETSSARRQLNTAEIRRRNLQSVFRYLLEMDRASVQNIADNLNISRPTVLQAVKVLEEQGLAAEDGKFQSDGGRRANAVRCIPNAKYAVGLDITKNHVGFVATDLKEKPIRQKRIYHPFARSEEYRNILHQELKKFLNDLPLTIDNLLGIGVSVPGIINESNGHLTISNVLGLGEMSQEELIGNFPVQTKLINDANAAGITEFLQNTKENIFYLGLNNSVGGAFFMRTGTSENESVYEDVMSRLYAGTHWHSAEAGHIVIHPNGRTCYCGKKGCADPYISALVLSEHADGDLALFFRKVREGNAECSRVWDEYLDNLAIVVDNIYALFDCTVVVGGYVGNLIGPYIGVLRDRVSPRNTFEQNAAYLRAGTFHEEAPALGASVHMIEQFFLTLGN
ncbi:MAG: ROK family transcriptional regulator [Lachnospiraceae bacterium]|nr:ROK family transcriptional regulator [Lachnospiraceae bacterium]